MISIGMILKEVIRIAEVVETAEWWSDNHCQLLGLYPVFSSWR